MERAFASAEREQRDGARGVGVQGLAKASRRIVPLRDAFTADGRRITDDLDFDAVA